MKLLLPIDIEDVLASSNVPETLDEYDDETLYLLADEVRDEATHTAYESLIGVDAGTFTVTIASPGVVTKVAHGLTAGTPVLLQTTDTLPTGLVAGTIYYVSDPAADTFKLAATSGGAEINTSVSQAGTHTLIVEPNLGYPLSDASRWLDIGPTNRWGMFDRKIGTVTQADNAIVISMVASQRIGGLAFFNMDADEITVTVTDSGEGVVYDEEIGLVSYDNISDWYDYFFAPVLRRRDLFVENLPLYLGATIDVTISRPGDVAQIGNLVVGTIRELGETLLGLSVGIIDYSRKEADDFGGVDLVERGFRSTGGFQVVVDEILFDEVKNLLTDRRALPTVFIGTSEFSSGLFYGFARDWRLKLNARQVADLDIELESL